VAEEQEGQLRRLTDPLDALVGLVDHLGQGRDGEIGQLHGLEAGPQALNRVELRGVGGQALEYQPGPLGADPGAWRCCSVRAGRPTAAWPSRRPGSGAALSGAPRRSRARSPPPAGLARPGRARRPTAVALGRSAGGSATLRRRPGPRRRAGGRPQPDGHRRRTARPRAAGGPGADRVLVTIFPTSSRPPLRAASSTTMTAGAFTQGPISAARELRSPVRPSIFGYWYLVMDPQLGSPFQASSAASIS